jgi:hypothetical protein
MNQHPTIEEKARTGSAGEAVPDKEEENRAGPCCRSTPTGVSDKGPQTVRWWLCQPEVPEAGRLAVEEAQKKQPVIGLAAVSERV